MMAQRRGLMRSGFATARRLAHRECPEHGLISHRQPVTHPANRDRSQLPMPAILLVEDNVDNRETLSRVMAIMGYEIVSAESGEEALRVLDERDDILLVLCDIRLPGMGGIAFRATARQRYPSTKIAFVTGDLEAADDAIQHGAIAMLKPYDFKVMTRVIEEALGQLSES